MSSVAIFGATGALGSDIARLLEERGTHITRIGRSHSAHVDISTSDADWVQLAKSRGPLSGVIWAQGTNSSGTILTTTPTDLAHAFESNVGFIHSTMQALVAGNALQKPCRTVILSSIWQEHARGNKFAYMTSKAALSGFVKSAAIDLAELGISVNAVLPGVIDTPMTRANLSLEQIEKVEATSLGGRLATTQNVASSVNWLLSSESAGVNGQFITVDEGWTIHRNV